MPVRRLQSEDAIARVTVEVELSTVRVFVHGELDFSSATLLDAITDVDLDGVTTVHIDLARVSFCDVAGFSAVARLHDGQRRERRLVQVLNPQPSFRRLAELIGRADLVAA